MLRSKAEVESNAGDLGDRLIESSWINLPKESVEADYVKSGTENGGDASTLTIVG
ncbi:hypothetical protein GYMLUDRAFT_44437 [Collybiopsis luxurians FD-317 M1]|uniref:Uncharacterized protein n=1 Tax=Collybiopsis luxurians FD-317 M1 TaxID=944289 RepID=A0A0D0CAG7_9AGAR|nr:hypothetical protein GYMLUDRAFT_44437 [Collybiopsis luxurians FD-317 M1]